LKADDEKVGDPAMPNDDKGEDGKLWRGLRVKALVPTECVDGPKCFDAARGESAPLMNDSSSSTDRVSSEQTEA